MTLMDQRQSFLLAEVFNKSWCGYSLNTKLDIPYKDDLYIGAHIYYGDSDDETNFGAYW